jgi:hypothetical protein
LQQKDKKVLQPCHQIDLRFINSAQTPTISKRVKTSQPLNKGSGATLLEVIEVEVHNAEASLKQILLETNRRKFRMRRDNVLATSLDHLPTLIPPMRRLSL